MHADYESSLLIKSAALRPGDARLASHPADARRHATASFISVYWCRLLLSGDDAR